jgi:hypothetical protein
MFVLGHLGIGGRLAAPFTEARERGFLYFGALLPDLIDKPLYYGLVLFTDRRGADLGLISGTRTIGHTALLGLLIFVLLRRNHGAAIALGIATHLALDAFGDVFGFLLPAHAGPSGPPTMAAVLYPLLGPRFPIAGFKSFGEHMFFSANAYVLAGELIGGAALLWQWRSERRQK